MTHTIQQQIGLLETLDLTYPLPKVWGGASAHIGPVQMMTKQVQNLCDKTTCGTVTMMAAVILWAAKRLEGFTDTSFMYELAEASFAWHYDWRYVDHTAQPYFQAPDEPIEESASLKIDYFLRYVLKGEDSWHSFYQPVMQLSHMINITNYILEDKKNQTKFKAWLKKLNERLNKIALALDMEVPDFYSFENKKLYWEHCAPRRGKPLPPLVLDMDKDMSTYDLDMEAKKFLQSLDYTKNRFLRSPEAMKELGFIGESYTI